MKVNLKALIGRLNDPCRSALEGAAGLCLSRTNYDVEIEHLLLKLMEAADSDLARILRQYEIDPSRLSKDITRALDRLKTGNSRTPASLRYGTPISNRGKCGPNVVGPVPGERAMVSATIGM